ncbi:MAG: hypothetical protein DRJ69_03830 [Thermoprotei archaeon]|nr:MAG: hypothetical protein DRJ69_03830 [Thermoprotei archaeon]
MLSRAVEEGLTLLVVGDSTTRAMVFVKAAASSSRRQPSLFFSPYPGFTRLLVRASRALGAEGLMDSVLVSTVAAEPSKLEEVVGSLSSMLTEGLASVVAFDSLFAPALKAAGRDVVERGRLASALSRLRALARKGRVCALIMEASEPPRLISRYVDAAWPQAPLTRLEP